MKIFTPPKDDDGNIKINYPLTGRRLETRAVPQRQPNITTSPRGKVTVIRVH
jgi:hypothetical protein